MVRWLDADLLERELRTRAQKHRRMIAGVMHESQANRLDAIATALEEMAGAVHDATTTRSKVP